MAEQRVLVVGGDNEMFAYRTAVCLASAGFGVSAVTPHRMSSLRWSRFVDGTTRMAPWLFEPSGLATRTEHVSVALALAVARHRADVVFPTDLPALVACTTVAPYLSVPMIATPSPDAVASCQDKARFGRLLESIGCSAPAAMSVIESIGDLDRVEIDRPMIAKPVGGEGGIGVARVDDIDALARHIRSGSPGTQLPQLVQEFIPGHDIDCSFYAEGGRILASAVQTRRSPQDRRIDFVAEERVIAQCDMVVAALEYDGLGHADLRIDERDGSVRVIELNPRVWGSVHYAHAVGANFPELAVQRALGQEATVPASPIGPCRDPELDVSAALRGLTGRPVSPPTSLNEAEQRMYLARHTDPVPLVLQRLRARLRRTRPATAKTRRSSVPVSC